MRFATFGEIKVYWLYEHELDALGASSSASLFLNFALLLLPISITVGRCKNCWIAARKSRLVRTKAIGENGRGCRGKVPAEQTAAAGWTQLGGNHE
ncbi:MAG: hypothetical protein ACRELG_15935 [Gemmataceae bacterium]